MDTKVHARTRFFRHAAALAVVALLLAGLLPAPVHARPIRVRRDRTDNKLYFSYRSDTASIPLATSGRRIQSGDRVDFLATVATRPAAPVGRRLLGKLTLRLTGRRGVRYRGRFAYVVKRAGGATVYRGTRRENILLRPRPGERRAVLRFRFDLTGGNYVALGRFRAT